MGVGKFANASEAKDTLPSFLPAGTSYPSPLVCREKKKKGQLTHILIRNHGFIYQQIVLREISMINTKNSDFKESREMMSVSYYLHTVSSCKSEYIRT